MSDRARVLICRASKCSNGGVPIQMTFGADVLSAICGVCGQSITDVTPDLGT